MSQEKLGYTDLEFNINCSYYSHDLKESLNGRVSNILVFLQILLGSSVMGKIGSPSVVGFLIAALAAMQSAFKFSDAAAVSRSSRIAYSRLRDRIRGNDENPEIFHDIQEKYDEEFSKEHHVSSSYSKVGQQCAYIKLGCKDRVELTWWHKTLAILGGATQIFEGKRSS